MHVPLFLRYLERVDADSMTEAASSSELTGFVRQLVATVATTLSKKPLEEDVLVNLESSDENFQR